MTGLNVGTKGENGKINNRREIVIFNTEQLHANRLNRHLASFKNNTNHRNVHHVVYVGSAILFILGTIKKSG